MAGNPQYGNNIKFKKPRNFKPDWRKLIPFHKDERTVCVAIQGIQQPLPPQLGHQVIFETSADDIFDTDWIMLRYEFIHFELPWKVMGVMAFLKNFIIHYTGCCN